MNKASQILYEVEEIFLRVKNHMERNGLDMPCDSATYSFTRKDVELKLKQLKILSAAIIDSYIRIDTK